MFGCGRIVPWFAVVALLSVTDARAQGENFSAGKTPAQLFNSDCSSCHQKPQGLVGNRSTGAVADFLREHYTTSRDTAKMLADFLTSGDMRKPPPGVARRPGQVEAGEGKRKRHPAADDADEPPRGQRATRAEGPGAERQNTAKPEEAAKPRRRAKPEEDTKPGSANAAASRSDPKSKRKTHATTPEKPATAPNPLMQLFD